MSQEEDPMAAYTTLVNLPHFLSSFTSLETGALVLFLVAVFTVQLILLQNYSGRRRWLPLILCAVCRGAAGFGAWDSGGKIPVPVRIFRRRLVQPSASGVQRVPSATVFCLGGAVRRPPGSADISHFKEITHLIPTYMVQGKEKRAGGGSGPALLALERI